MSQQLPEPWHINNFSGGMIDKLDDNLLPENASPDCSNVISLQDGALESRQGQVRHNTTLFPSSAIGSTYSKVRGIYSYKKDDTGNLLMVAVNGRVGYYLKTIDELVEVKGGLSLSDTWFVRTVNHIAVFNGHNEPWMWSHPDDIIIPITDVPVNGRYPIMHKERIFCTSLSEPTVLRWSDPFEPLLWPGVNYWVVTGSDDGEWISGLQVYRDELIVFKQKSFHVLRGSNMNDFRMSKVSGEFGCTGARASTTHGLALYFVNEDGICLFDGVNTTNISANVIPLFWEGINKNALFRAVAFTWKDNIWFALPRIGSNENNVVLVYVPKSGAWWVYNGLNIACVTKHPKDIVDISLQLITGDSLTSYANQIDVGTTDFGQPITSYWRGKAFDVGNAAYGKKSKKIFLHDYPDTTTPAGLSLSFDYATPTPATMSRGDDFIREYLTGRSQRWRYFSPIITHSGPGKLHLRGMTMPYKVKAKPKVSQYSVED